MKQAQAMQENLKKAQDELGNIEVTGESGAGLVKVVMTGKHQLRSVTIDPSLMTTDPDDRETLQDLITAAINEAVNKVEAESSQRMSAATAGMPLPPGFKL